MIKQRLPVLLSMAIALMAVTRTWADHCPDGKIAMVDPETSLAGIELGRDRAADVIAGLGTPDSYKEHDGWAKYKWKRGAAAIKVMSGGAGTEAIELVQVSGEPSGSVRGTGRGLRLGQEWKDAVALYGATYVDGPVSGLGLGDRTVTFCFSNETELSIGLDAKDRVVAIRLQESVE